MIVGLGLDVTELRRIRRSLERFGNAFCAKVLHPEEMRGMPAVESVPSSSATAWLAGRFCAKEAAVKALGTGFTGGIGLHDVRVLSLPSGGPELTFHGRAKARAEALGASTVHLSLSHSRDTAAAVVILERLP